METHQPRRISRFLSLGRPEGRHSSLCFASFPRPLRDRVRKIALRGKREEPAGVGTPGKCWEITDQCSLSPSRSSPRVSVVSAWICRGLGVRLCVFAQGCMLHASTCIVRYFLLPVKSEVQLMAQRTGEEAGHQVGMEAGCGAENLLLLQ